MFTGIVADMGEVRAIRELDSGVRIRIGTRFDQEGIDLGASIACGGPCLTVVERGSDLGAAFFDVEASVETLDRTTVGDWRVGTRVNLERALRMGDELGGHMVTGHIDGVAEIVRRDEAGDMARFNFRAPARLARYIAEKGSVCLDGTSLTVNSVDGDDFTVMIIPHTLSVTTWGERRQGDRVNLEVDLFARYLERLGTANSEGRGH